MSKSSEQAQAAKLIRKLLKSHFPSVSFRVTSTSFSGGTSIRISWIEGPTVDQIRELTHHFTYGNFDPMRDLYEYTNCNSSLPQVKYIHCDREIREEVIEGIFHSYKRSHHGWDILEDKDEYSEGFFKEWGHNTPAQYITHQLHDKDLTPAL